MQKFLALLFSVCALGSLTGCKQLGCDKPAAPSTEAAPAAPAHEAAPAAPEANEDKAA